MLWEHEPQASVSTAFLRKHRDEKHRDEENKNNLLTLTIKM